MSKVSLQAYFDTAKALVNERKLPEARRIINEILQVNPNHLPSRLLKCRSLIIEGKLEEAYAYNIESIKRFGNDINLLLQSSKIAMKLNDMDRAGSILGSLLKQHPKSEQILFQAGLYYRRINDLETAKELYKQVLETNPNHVLVANNLANIYQLQYEYDEAIKLYNKLINGGISESLIYSNKASLLFKMGKIEDALKLFDQSLKLNEQNTFSLYNLSLIYHFKHDLKTSRNYLNRVLEIDNKNVKWLSHQALINYTEGKRKEAKETLNLLIESNPNEPEPYLKLARILVDELRFKDVVELLKPIADNTSETEIFYLLGIAFEQVQGFDKAREYLNKITDHPVYRLRALMTLQAIATKCGELFLYDELLSKVTAALQDYLQGSIEELDIPVYNLAYYPFDERLSTSVLKRHASKLEKRMSIIRHNLDFEFKKESYAKLKIGYISPNFRQHPDALLTKDLFRYHNHDKYEIYVFSLSAITDDVTLDIKRNADHYFDLSMKTSIEAASMIHELGIQILTCLSGYNLGMRMEIPALKPAPIQTMYMGYNESTQSEFIDYVFSDDQVITSGNRQSFNESMVKLPISYFANSVMKAGNINALKSDYGIPENVFVFGCLNHPRKLTPEIVEAWAEILRDTDQSVLWLYSTNDIAVRNLKQTFKQLGIDPNRVLFCNNESYSKHLSRFQIIDLFLDTTVYNGHTTCLESLWMQVPVLTVPGKSVSARICSSFLKSLQLNELICDDLHAYVRLAVELRNDLSRLMAIKDRLKSSQESETGIFNIKDKVRKIESAYDKMWFNFTEGYKPSDLEIN